MIGYLALAAYVATIPAANWMIGNFGYCIHNGPCMIPVGFGLHAPSGVLMIGAALVLRDIVQDKLGVTPSIAAILAGTALSSLFAPPALVLASGAAFMLAEFCDMAIYTPLRRRGMALAVLVSGVIGAAVDSAIFLIIAFGSADFIAGQILGKLAVSAVSSAAILAIGLRRDAIMDMG